MPAFSQLKYTPTLIQSPSQRLWFFCLAPNNPFLFGKLECKPLLVAAVTLSTLSETIIELQCMITIKPDPRFSGSFFLKFAQSIGLLVTADQKQKHVDSRDKVGLYLKITKNKIKHNWTSIDHTTTTFSCLVN